MGVTGAARVEVTGVSVDLLELTGGSTLDPWVRMADMGYIIDTIQVPERVIESRGRQARDTMRYVGIIP